MSGITERIAHVSPVKLALMVQRMRASLGGGALLSAEPIAVIGMGCRFPGGADSPEAFWELLRQGTDCIGEVPASRWPLDAFYDPEPGTPGKMYCRWGGFVEPIDQFDPHFFGIAPREAMALDPQQRLLLEVAYEALERAGLPPEQLGGTRTGVFVGIMNNDYLQLHSRGGALEQIDAYIGTGNIFSVAAGRIAYVLGLQGPCVALDTACSSSLVTVHLACQALRGRECALALAGGVNAILTPESTVAASQAGILARDGRCKAFDAAADGYVRAEGCGVVVLKRLSDALSDGDPVLAVIRGSAVNHDGRSSGLTVPNGPAQQAVIRQALRSAGVEPSQVGYVEAHGTGTALGDPIEIQALGAVLGQGRPPAQPLLIGGVKTNIGHLESAAGVAGLIKTVLVLQHGEIPPHLHLRQLNPLISLDGIPARIPTAPTPWQPASGRRIAGVSSFGLSGTNAHVVLEEAGADAAPAPAAAGPGPWLLPLSARSDAALRALAGRYAALLARDDAPPLPDLCFSAACRRGHHEQRLALLGDTAGQLAERLAAFAEGQPAQGLAEGRGLPQPARRVAMVFSGQGSQWVGMGRDLLAAEPVFRAAVEQCDAAFRPFVQWSLLEELAAEGPRSRLDQTDVFQPAIFAVQVGLVALWRSWGVTPDAVVGHSMGEVAAAHVAGALSLADAARVTCLRSALMRRLSGQGAVALLELPHEEVAELLAPHGERLALAGINSARATVVAGDSAALDGLLADVAARGVFCRRVNMDVAAHSPQIDPLLPELRAALADIRPVEAALPFYSTVLAAPCEGQALGPDYWARNMRDTVRFAPAVGRLLADGYRVLLEVGPHPVLLPSLTELGGDEALALPTLRRDEPARATMLGTLARLYARGAQPDWRALYPAGRPLALPAYPWQRQRFWLAAEPQPGRPRRAPGAHPLLARRMALASHAGGLAWEADLDRAALLYLDDHRVRGVAILPAAVYLELAMAVAGELAGAYAVEDLAFKQALALPEAGAQTLQVIAGQRGADAVTLQFFSRAADAPADAPWLLHAEGLLRRDDGAAPPAPPALDALRAQGQPLTAEVFYGALAQHGMDYGPAFQGVAEVWRGDGAALARLALPAAAGSAGGYRVHPALLDACFQTLGAALAGDGGDGAVPVLLERLRLYGRPAGTLWAYATLREPAGGAQAGPSGDLLLLDDAGQLVLEARGLHTQSLDAGGARRSLADWCYTLDWRHRPLTAGGGAAGGSWLILADQGGRAERLAASLEALGGSVTLALAGPGYRQLAPGRYQLAPDSPDDWARLLADACPEGCRAIIHTWALDVPVPDDGAATEQALRLTCDSALRLAQALAQAGWTTPPRLWLITAGAQPVECTPAVGQAPLWGLGGVIASEHPELRCTRVDLGPGAPEGDLAPLLDELLAEDGENQLALRGGRRLAARLAPWLPPARPAVVAPAGERGFRLALGTPGRLDSLALRVAPRQTPGPGQVEIAVRAAGLNFLDVLAAMGMRPDADADLGVLGGECAGVVVALGAGVTDLRLGDPVVAVAPASFGRYTTTSAQFVAPLPAGQDWAAAATLPIAFLTAHYALRTVAQLQPGERVLIHAAAGGVGLAALQVAHACGATVFATAGSAEKRAYLRTLGVTHVYDSRTLDFAAAIRADTGGQGVDVVLNALTGPAIAHGLATLAPYGRFVEIGKRDIYADEKLGLRPFHQNLSYHAVDLARMFVERPARCGALLRAVLAEVAAGTYTPLPHTTYALADAEAAFREMAQARHIGKLVLTLDDAAAVAVADVGGGPTVRATGSYLITGGLGGLGLAVAQWLVGQGARHLLLLGRRAPGPDAQAVLDGLAAQGAQVLVASADVADAGQLAAALDRAAHELPPLRGVVHAAGVLDDGFLQQQTPERFRQVIAPKLVGAWHLHRLTAGQPLDFFALFSSASALLGTPGQGSYVAANAGLDALAHWRQAQGLPATSINWGPWAEVGMAAGPGHAERLAAQGMRAMTPGQGVQAFGLLLAHAPAQAAVIPLTPAEWARHPLAAAVPLLADLAQGGAAPALAQAALRAALEELPSDWQRRALLERQLQEQLGQVLRVAPESIDPATPFQAMGLDSLMGLELRNRIEAGLGVTLPATLVWNYPTISELAGHLLERAGLAAPAAGPEAAAPAATAAAPPAVALDELEQLSDDEAEALLAAQLEAFERKKQ